jgi:hypothetical protein
MSEEKNSNSKKTVRVNTIDLPTISVPEPRSLQNSSKSKSKKASRSQSFHSDNGKESKFDRTAKRQSMQRQFSTDQDETDHVMIRKPTRPITLKSSFLRKKQKEYEGKKKKISATILWTTFFC